MPGNEIFHFHVHVEMEEKELVKQKLENSARKCCQRKLFIAVSFVNHKSESEM